MFLECSRAFDGTDNGDDSIGQTPSLMHVVVVVFCVRNSSTDLKERSGNGIATRFVGSIV